MSYMTEDEIVMLDLSDLNRDTPFMITNVSYTQLSIAKFYGAINYNGVIFEYMPETDELVRHDVVKWLAKFRKKPKVKKVVSEQLFQEP